VNKDGDIRRVHRTSTKTTQDAIQGARVHVEMHRCTSYLTCTSHVE